jgi:hypothetical protein
MRITKKQKEIFDAHLKAFKDNKFDQELFGSDSSPEAIRNILLEGKTIRSFWTYVYQESTTITSQLMSSQLSYVSKKSIQDSRNFTKRLLNKLNIS